MPGKCDAKRQRCVVARHAESRSAGFASAKCYRVRSLSMWTLPDRRPFVARHDLMPSRADERPHAQAGAGADTRTREAFDRVAMGHENPRVLDGAVIAGCEPWAGVISQRKESSMTFKDQRVVITGGASGIGLATARAVVARGGQVVLASRDAERLASAATLLGSAATTQVLDVTDEAAVAAFFAGIGSFDHLVTAAAGTARGKVVELDTAQARALFESKYWGQYHCAKYGIPQMRPSGSVTLFSGWLNRKPMPGTSTLATINGAIEALARTLAIEVAPIRVNAVVPGMIDTPLWSARLSPEQQREHFANVGRALPVGRAGTADDVAHAVVYLMENGFTTGAVLDVDGGQK